MGNVLEVLRAAALHVAPIGAGMVAQVRRVTAVEVASFGAAATVSMIRLQDLAAAVAGVEVDEGGMLEAALANRSVEERATFIVEHAKLQQAWAAAALVGLGMEGGDIQPCRLSLDEPSAGNVINVRDLSTDVLGAIARAAQAHTNGSEEVARRLTAAFRQPSGASDAARGGRDGASVGHDSGGDLAG